MSSAIEHIKSVTVECKIKEKYCNNYSINCPEHLLNFWTLRVEVGAHSRVGAY